MYLFRVLILYQAIGTRVLQRTTNLLDGVKDANVTKDKFIYSILPIGFLFSGSLVLSNSAYLHLSVAFIQMLKVMLAIKPSDSVPDLFVPLQAFNPVAILLISFAFRLQEPNRKLILIVLMISCGVSIASYGELEFDILGFIIQSLAVIVRPVFINDQLHLIASIV